MRLALKLATGAGKTTVMAMLIAWQTINAVRRPGSKKFTRGFLVVTPGLTIRDRLRVLQPNDPDSYYAEPRAGPERHARRPRPRQDRHHQLPRLQAARAHGAVQGRPLAAAGPRRPNSDTLETEGQMLQRVMPDLMGMKNILVLNDEAHHCYREKPERGRRGDLKGDDKKEAEKNNEAARLWISGLEAVNRKLGVARVIDLSATPFFLRGSGYAEGTLFPWTMSDFSLMDAIECGIVKLPACRWPTTSPAARCRCSATSGSTSARRCRRRAAARPKPSTRSACPLELQTALEALYGHYEKTFELWQKAGIHVPPCFIVVCNNTSTSKLVYDYISGFQRENEDGSTTLENGRLALFRNFDEHGNPLARPRHAADRQRAARIRRGAGRQLPRAWPPTRSSGSAARSSSAPATCARPRTSPTRTCCARS